MKKSLKLFMLSLITVLASCEKVDLKTQETPTALQRGIPSTEITAGYGDVKAWSINNGLPSTCAKNILVFKSWNRYHQVIQYLDDQTEQYCDAFDAAQPAGQTEAEYESVCIRLNFDEDNKLIELENKYTFCSLRKKLNLLEAAWLEAQGDGDWGTANDPDPDDHFIVDEMERTVLNEGAEVIIGPIDVGRKNYILYKRNPDGSIYIIPIVVVSSTNNTIVNTGAVTSLQQINAGTFVPASNLSVTLIEPPKPIPPPGCKYEVKGKNYAYDGNSRIQWKAKAYTSNGVSYPSQNSDGTWTQGSAIVPGKFIAKTRSFKRRSSGGWKTHRAWITVGIQGTSFENCTKQEVVNVMKERRRRKVKVILTLSPFDGILPTLRNRSVQDNLLYSKHIKGNINFSQDYYDL